MRMPFASHHIGQTEGGHHCAKQNRIHGIRYVLTEIAFECIYPLGTTPQKIDRFQNSEQF